MARKSNWGRSARKIPAKYSHLSSSASSSTGRKEEMIGIRTNGQTVGRGLDEICRGYRKGPKDGSYGMRDSPSRPPLATQLRVCHLDCPCRTAAAATITISFPTFLVCPFEVTWRPQPGREGGRAQTISRPSVCRLFSGRTDDDRRRFFEIGLPSFIFTLMSK